MTHQWDDCYAAGTMPWDTGEPDPELVKLVDAGRLPRGRALDIGCGTGSDSRYLASRGYHVLGIDIAPRAIELAKAAPAPPAGSVEFRQHDFLAAPVPGGPFDLVFDRGCFHVFDEAADRRRYAERVAECLGPDGLWVSLIGSTEGPPREFGPPRRSARDIVAAVEPSLAISELRAFEFHLRMPAPITAWVLIAHRRAVPAQPSTRRD